MRTEAALGIHIEELHFREQLLRPHIADAASTWNWKQAYTTKYKHTHPYGQGFGITFVLCAAPGNTVLCNRASTAFPMTVTDGTVEFSSAELRSIGAVLVLVDETGGAIIVAVVIIL